MFPAFGGYLKPTYGAAGSGSFCLSRAVLGMVLKVGVMNAKKTLQSPEQGCLTTVWAAVGKGLEGKGGKYLERCRVSVPFRRGYAVIEPGHAAHAYNEEDARLLWQVMNELVGLAEEE